MNKILLGLLLCLAIPIALADSTHVCQGNSCNDVPPASGGEQSQSQEQTQGQSQGQAQSSYNANANANTNANDNANYNTNVASGGAGGAGGNAEQGQSQLSLNENSNSSNNSSSQSTNINFEAAKQKRFGNNVSAIAPNIYSSSACTAGGLTGAASALGVGVSLGGAKQDIQCQVRENARILAGVDAGLAIEYLCRNTKVDIGATLGDLCKYTPPVVEQPIVVPPPEVAPPIITTNADVHGK